MIGAVSGKVKNADHSGNGDITLMVKVAGEKESFFSIGRATPLKKLMDIYCDHLSVDRDIAFSLSDGRLFKDRDTILFLSDSRILSYENTPDELGLKDGDKIEVELCLKRITLKIKDLNEEEVLYRVNCFVPLKKLMIDFCNRRSIDRDAILFIRDGKGLSGEMTPDELRLKDGDEIEVEQRGNRISLKVKDQHENEELFRIKRSTPLKNLMNSFSDRLSVNRRKSTAVFILKDDIICGDKTPDELGLEDGDELEAMPLLKGCICGCGSYSIM